MGSRELLADLTVNGLHVRVEHIVDADGDHAIELSGLDCTLSGEMPGLYYLAAATPADNAHAALRQLGIEATQQNLDDLVALGENAGQTDIASLLTLAGEHWGASGYVCPTCDSSARGCVPGECRS